MQRIPMYMVDWIKKLDAFISISNRQILDNAGKISHELALETVNREYDMFNTKRIAANFQAPSDFDKAIEKLPPYPFRKYVQ